MRSTDDPEFLTYLREENDYTAQWFADIDATVDDIDAQIRSRIQQTDVSAAVPHGGWFYASRTEEGLPYPILCRGRSAAEATDAIQSTTLLNLNQEAEGHEFFDLGTFEPCPDHTLIAWSADVTGDEHHTLRIRNAEDGTDLPDRIDDTAASGVAWSSDATTILYVVADEMERPYQVRSHRLGTDQLNDTVIWTEDDERFYVGIGATRSGRWVVIHSGSRTTSEVHLIPTDHVDAVPICVQERIPGIDYQVDDWGDALVMLTNEDAEDFKVLLAPSDNHVQWTEFIPHQPGRRITAIEPFAEFLAVHEWSEAQPQIRVVARDGASRTIAISDEPHDVEFGPNEEFNSDRLRIVFQSLTMAPTVADVHTSDLTIDVVRQTPTPNVRLDDYVAERRWATGHDGHRVPYDLVRHRDTSLNGSAPAVIYAYGAYEVSLPPWYSSARLSLLDRGAIWVLAHPRGGGELGRRWYLEGRLKQKRNTFLDVIAVTEDLAATHVADPSRIGVRGGSAGGLMVGGCLAMRPELFKTAVAEVPFVDVVSTMSDPTLPLTVNEWEEWGDPRNPEFCEYISSYSPYDNSAGLTIGSMLVTAGLNDPRVSVHEPAKWVARLRSEARSTGPVLLRTEMDSGHGGPSDRYAAWREEAMILAFILNTI